VPIRIPGRCIGEFLRCDPKAALSALDEHDVEAPGGELERGDDPGRTRADDGDIGAELGVGRQRA
jgi:hypothetical protein